VPERIYKGRPPRITPFGDISAPMYFLTCGTLHRNPWLANERVHAALRSYGEKGAAVGFAIGRYVMMPDHLHLFVRLAPDRRLDLSVRGLKRTLRDALGDTPSETCGDWQPGFFDHLLRNAESYGEKWRYVRENPVRAGLVAHPEAWPYAGEIVALRF
jgi:putative transposase